MQWSHVDIAYLPKIDGQKYYLFVAIDGATRLLYYKVYENKSSDNAVLLLKKCKEYFPFYITHILTDNGEEFTDRLISKNNKVSNNHKFDKECNKYNIKHRGEYLIGIRVAPYTLATNGMIERANGTIKNATIKIQKKYKNLTLKPKIRKFPYNIKLR